jgi:hypothetical protein
MKKTVIAMCIASGLISGCSPNLDMLKVKPSVPHIEVNQYDWTMQVFSKIEDKNFKRCLFVVQNPSGFDVSSDKDGGLKEISKCFLVVGGVAAKINAGRTVPAADSKEIQPILDKLSLESHFAEGKVLLSKRLTVISMSTAEEASGKTVIKSAKWQIGETDRFEISDKGAVWGRNMRKAIEPGTRTILGSNKKTNYVRTEGE